ncbi:MAG: nodulation protein NfeD [Acidimicrobiales bacterium]
MGVGSLLFAIVLSVGSAAAQTGPRVLTAEVDGAITPVMAAHVSDAISQAERGGYEALVLELDTPGGLDSSMRDIIKDILRARVPIGVYVSPAGARAASAGAIITFAAHFSAMAPGTAIGAATPISGGGDDLEAKATNDAAAYSESLARLRGRNVEFAIEAVRSARSISADEAVRIGAVDVLAGSVDELLAAVDGRTVHVGPESTATVLHTAGAGIDSFDMGLFRRVQQFLADPNLAFLLLSIATLGLIYELATPGLGAGGIIAATGFVLAMVGLAVLPINAVGIVFVVLGVMLFVAEVVSPGLGIAAAGGAVMFALGGVYFVDDAPGIEVSLAAVLPVAIATAALCALAGRLALRSRAAPSTLTGVGALIGQTVTIRVAAGRPQAFVEGSWWRARLPGGSLVDGDIARVRTVEDLELIVDRLDTSPTEQVTHNQNKEIQ